MSDEHEELGGESLTEAMASLADNLDSLLEVATGFKNKMLAGGWGLEAAENGANLVLNGLIIKTMGIGPTDGLEK